MLSVIFGDKAYKYRSTSHAVEPISAKEVLLPMENPVLEY